MAKVPFLEEDVVARRIVLKAASVGLSPRQFLRLCRDNPELRFELTAQKEIVIMPTNNETSILNANIIWQLTNWARQDKRGVVFESNAGFALSNGAKRSPDASWMLRKRWDAVPKRHKKALFAPFCPDFVLELSSPSDIFKELQLKMEEYIANGARLGFLIYPPDRQVFVYRPNQAPKQFDEPKAVFGDPELPGFTLDLTEIWQ